MALTFTPITAGATGKIINEASFDEEFKREWHEAHDYLTANPHVAGLSADHGSHEKREEWFNKAVAYGKTQGVAVSRVKGTDSMNKEHGRLAIAMESEADKRARVAEAAQRAERVMILKSHGHEVARGKKTPKIIAAEDEVLKKHYAMPVEEQREHLAKWMQEQND